MKSGKVLTVFHNFRSIVTRATQSVVLVVIILAFAMAAWFVSGNAIGPAFLIYLFLLTAAHFIGVFYSKDTLSPIGIISHYVDQDIKEEVLVIGGGILYAIYMASIAYCVVDLFLLGVNGDFRE